MVYSRSETLHHPGLYARIDDGTRYDFLEQIDVNGARAGDRQELHEKIRQLSMEAGRNVKVNGLDNNLLELIAQDPTFGMSLESLKACMEPSRYVGRAPQQVDEFLAEVIQPILDENKEVLGMTAEINV